MSSAKPNWKTNARAAAGKGATLQQFVATVGADRLEIEVAPWGDGQLRVNGREVAHINGAAGREQAFQSLRKTAERFLDVNGPKEASMIPAARAKLLEDKVGLIVGIANENSIA